MRLIVLLSLPLFAQAPDATADKLRWIAGCWEMRAGEMVIEEQWNKPSGGIMMGIGRTVKGGKLVETEYLQISIEKGRLTYTARIGTPGVTPFPVKSITDSEVVFENPEHDFPQRILYRKTPDGVFARIEGTSKGKERHVDFPYRKVSCE